MKRWYALIPLLLAIAVYAPAPWGELVWDDQIVLEKQLVAFKTVKDVFFPPEGIFEWAKHYYRPVVVLSYMLDIDLYGSKQIAGLHLSNVLYHVITTFFVWLLARRILRHTPNGSAGAVVTAVIFAVHPIHTESVSWITGRSDLLAGMFFVPSVTLALVWRDSGAKWALALGAALYFLALLSKEVAIAALIVVPAAFLLTPYPGDIQMNADGAAMRKGSGMRTPMASRYRTNIVMWLATAVMYLGVTGLYLALRQTSGVTYGVPLEVSWIEYFARLEKSVAYYLVKVFVPWPQSNYVAWDMTPGSAVANVVFLVAVGLLGLSILLWQRHRDGSLLFAVTWFGVTLAPSLMVAIRWISGTPLAERYLYLPSVAMALMLGAICCQPYLGKWPKLVTGAVAVLVIAYSFTTVERGIVWTSNLNLWTDATEKAPSHGEPWNLLGTAYENLGDFPNALEAYHRAIDEMSSPIGRSFAKRNIAIIYHSQNNLRRAKQYYSGALDETEENPEAHYGLGIIYLTESKSIEKEGAENDRAGTNLDLAAAHLESAIRLNPFHTDARWALASALTRQGQYWERERDLRQAIAHYRSAKAELDRLIAQDPSFQSRMAVQNTRALLAAALKRLAE
jgi:tetratricopeptide (TPR) repeat protein